MPAKLLVDLDAIDLSRVVRGTEDIQATVPQRHEMAQLEAIHHIDPDAGIVVGSREIREDEWWARGHIPGRPIFPGVLMVEAAAQLSTWLHRELTGDERFMGFVGLDRVRFRGTVEPESTLVLIAKLTESNRRRAVFECQGAVDGKLVFECVVTGMAV